MKEEDIRLIRPDALTPAEIESKAEEIGLSKVTARTGKTFLLAIMAGMYVGMGGMFMLLIKSEASYSFVTAQLLGGLAFCLGLFLVVAAGAELFTGNAILVCGRLSRKYRWGLVLKNWLTVYFGNFLGSLLLILILYGAHYSAFNGGAVGDALLTVAAGKIAQPFEVLLFKGIMCNFLVCLAVWITYGSRTIVDKFVGIILPIVAFVACGFEHCVANMFFLPFGLLLKQTGFDYSAAADLSSIDAGGIFYNLSAVTLGNIIGGLVLVGLVYWLAYSKKDKVKG